MNQIKTSSGRNSQKQKSAKKSRKHANMQRALGFEKDMLIELEIEDIGATGEGIGKYNGMTFFVKDAVIGDKISAKIMKMKKTYGYARLTELLEASPYRVEPRCSFAKACGGCQLQALSYEKQLEYKAEKVKNSLIRIGGVEEDWLEQITDPIVGMEEPYYYRNKAQFPVGRNKEGEIVAGFYANRTHSIIPNINCALGVDQNEIVLEKVLNFMREEQISPYNEENKRGIVRHILIRYGFFSTELMVCMVINGKTLPKQEILVDKLKDIPGIKSISLNHNTENTNVILGEKTTTIWGSSTITDSLFLRETKNFTRLDQSTSYQISPQSFYQVNPPQTEKLYSLALEYAKLSGEEIVWDLYCGIGTISLFLARNAKKVYGVEIVPQAIEDARKNAYFNQIKNAEFFVGKAEEILPEQFKQTKEAADVIVVDPPRKGCDEKCLETMINMQPKRIVYVSCDPATLARDVKVLIAGGYKLEKVRAVDQFPHTVHVETVCCLQRVNM